MIRSIPLVMLLLFTVPFVAGAQETIKKGDRLDLSRCLEISLKMHPNISAAKSAEEVSRTRVGQAESNRYPQINASAGYSRIHAFSGSSSSSLGNKSGSFDQYSAAVALQQTIYDFGKTTAQIDIQKLNVGSSGADTENTEEQVTFNVKQAYFGVLKAKRNRDVAEESVRQFQQHLEQAKGFFEVGTKPKFDVTKAEVDLSNAKLNLIRAESALKLSFVNLNNAMGVPDASEYTVEDNLSFTKYEIKLDEAINNAYRTRPDMKSLLSKKAAAERSVELAKKGYYPVINGNAGYSKSGQSFPLGDGWNLGVALSFPVFNGFLTKYQVEEASSTLKVIQANEEALKQGILLDVQQAFLNLSVAEESIATAELTVKQANENFDIANGRYAAGVGNPIEVTDAEVLLSNAKTTYNQSLYDYKVARAGMEKAMGMR